MKQRKRSTNDWLMILKDQWAMGDPCQPPRHIVIINTFIHHPSSIINAVLVIGVIALDIVSIVQLRSLPTCTPAPQIALRKVEHEHVKHLGRPTIAHPLTNHCLLH